MRKYAVNRHCIWLAFVIWLFKSWTKNVLLFAFEEGTKFEEASEKGNLIPLYQCIFSDQLTPVLAYRILLKEDDREAPSFLFESAEPSYHASSVVSSF